MAKLGREDKLTPEREATIVGAIRQVGVTQEEAAKLAGISERTFYAWKSRAKEVMKTLPADWRQKSGGELQEYMDDLGISESDVVPTGKGRRRLKRDYVAAIHLSAGKYRDFFEALDRAMLEGEVSTVSEYRAIAQGGQWRRNSEGEREWVPIRTVRERQRLVVVDGEEVWQTVGRDIVEHPPNEKALRFILDRRYDRFYRKKPVDPNASPGDPVKVAARIHRALREMEETVTGAAEG
jgi:hypothetical protein